VTRDFKPRPYQSIALGHLLDTPRCALWAGMGMGKTSSTLAALDILHNVLGEDRPTLVLAPKRVATSTWPDERRKWRQFGGLDISAVVGTPAERERALKRDVPIFTTNYDNLVWLVDHFGDRWPFATIVADESTRLKSFRIKQGGVRAAALGKVVHKHVERFIELTGTPSPNGLQDLWGQAWMLDQGQRLGRTFSGFKDRWFQTVPGGQGYSQIRPLAHAQAEIQALLGDLCLTLDPKDWFDLRVPIVNEIRVPLPAKARTAYEEMEREMFLQLEGHDIEAFGAAARTIKCLQLANGAAYVGEGNKEYVEVHDAKLQALDSIITEAAGAPVLVAYHFKSDLARLLRAFPQGRPLDADPATVADWNAGRIPVLFAHPASAGHGLNLQDGGNILAFFGHWWDLEQHDQVIERIGPVRQAQAGHDRPVFIHYIVAEDTVDELVMARRDSKREVQDLLLEAMKRRMR
jgi:SNF2 family DNA or RNA helicase